MLPQQQQQQQQQQNTVVLNILFWNKEKIKTKQITMQFADFMSI